jgi:3-deoxy-D-manno-octulosonate 8-phosphate phosphatase (KDO 8-P phosphatase)
MKNKSLIFAKARNIKLLASDIDGVLTAGQMLYCGLEELKIWNVKDGLGYVALRKVFPEIKTAWITGRSSKEVQRRAKEIKIDFLFMNTMNKGEVLLDLIKKIGIDAKQSAFVGDDLPDISPLEIAGLSICPKDAVDMVKEKVDYISKFDGGQGVIRELIDMIFEARGAKKMLLEKYR